MARRFSLIGASSIALMAGASANAQVAPSQAARAGSEEIPKEATADQGSASALGEEIIVTATKRAENVQDVPLAVTAYGTAQLEALNFRNINTLATSMPNVALDDNGSTKNFANFAIRGLGTNSSIPSIDPTVGLFIDGVYQGIQAGQVLDNFDLEAIEALRGPQGVLFGRNVTGGAILVRTRRPSKRLEMRSRVAVETGPRVVVDAAVSGPLVKDVLLAKLAVYSSYDSGFFTNLANGEEIGQDKQFIIRPMLLISPTQNLEFLLRYEHGNARGGGPATQNHALFSRNSFDFTINEKGFYKQDWDSATAEMNLDVGLGDGKITNIFGWRKFESDSLSDIDGRAVTVFHIGNYIKQHQFSNELRYAGTFGNFEVTTGLYYFTQDLKYLENRVLGPVLRRVGGGIGTFDTKGAFAAVDWHFTSSLTLNLGVRYSQETKDVEIATVRTGGGNYDARTLNTDFKDSESWNDVSPKVGVQFEPGAHTQFYGFYAKGFRSGGYNFRNTVLGAPPGPFDAEALDAYEIGVKQAIPSIRGRLNAAAFQNTVDKIQREVQLAVPAVGIAQLIRNAGKARVRGFEIEGQAEFIRHLVIGGHVGYLNGKYKSLELDLNNDGVINSVDFGLKLPRLAPWTYGAFAVLDVPFADFGTLSTRLSYNHRDASRYTDDNRGFLKKSDTIDANATFTPTGGEVTFSIYGINLTDQANSGNDSVLPDIASFGGDGPAGPRPLPTFSPLTRGRVIGVEVRSKF